MKNLSHPGETLREDVLPALNLTVERAAEKIGVAAETLAEVLQCRSPITPDLAARIEAWLGIENGGRAEAWLAQQSAYDRSEVINDV
jgi:addiction module HigA family antidote